MRRWLWFHIMQSSRRNEPFVLTEAHSSTTAVQAGCEVKNERNCSNFSLEIKITMKLLFWIEFSHQFRFHRQYRHAFIPFFPKAQQSCVEE